MLLFLHQTINCPILLGLTFISVNVQREIWSKEKEVEADDDFQRLYTVSFFTNILNFKKLSNFRNGNENTPVI